MHNKERKGSDSGRIDYRIALVGNPNVGKRALFGLLTGKYVTVSNYPGTTVEIARDILLRDEEKKIIQIIDAKNIHWGLLIATQLAEMGLRVSIGLNMWDEI